MLGPDGFDAVGRLLEGSLVARMTYSELADAIVAIRELVSRVKGDG
jgi:hypothetical protein